MIWVIVRLFTMRLCACGLVAAPALTFSAATNETRVPSSVDQEIQPFSSLRWDDGLVDVVTKLNKLPALKTLTWQVGGVSPRKSVLNVIKAEELADFASILYDRSMTAEFTDQDGKKALLPGARWRSMIVAQEVNIAGIPFELSANLELEPGFAVTYPGKTLKFSIQKGAVVLPAVLTDVELTSKSKVIVDNLDELIAAAKAKYPKGATSDVKQERSRRGTFTCTDRLGHQFTLTWSVGAMGASARISYEHTSADAKWAELYRKHLASLEEKRIEVNRDLKSEL
jgi:hypothetical protein